MSAGHSLRRQNYSFVTITPPNVQATPAMHTMRIIVVVIAAIAVDLATFASVSMLVGR
ncbi:MAG: hypothetical protein ACRDF9_11225 [Candidatus Limnocylindria bacterium]